MFWELFFVYSMCGVLAILLALHHKEKYNRQKRKTDTLRKKEEDHFEDVPLVDHTGKFRIHLPW